MISCNCFWSCQNSMNVVSSGNRMGRHPICTVQHACGWTITFNSVGSVVTGQQLGRLADLTQQRATSGSGATWSACLLAGPTSKHLWSQNKNLTRISKNLWRTKTACHCGLRSQSATLSSRRWPHWVEKNLLCYLLPYSRFPLSTFYSLYALVGQFL